MVLATKQISKMGKNNPLIAILFPERLWPSCGQKRPQQTPRNCGLLSNSLGITKTDPHLGKQQQKCQAKSPPTELSKNDFLVMGKMKKTVKNVNGECTAAPKT